MMTASSIESPALVVPGQIYHVKGERNPFEPLDAKILAVQGEWCQYSLRTGSGDWSCTPFLGSDKIDSFLRRYQLAELPS